MKGSLDGRRSRSAPSRRRVIALAGVVVLASALGAGCRNRSDKVFPIAGAAPPPYQPGFGSAQAVDPAPATTVSATTFDRSRHVAIDKSGNAIILMRAPDGTGVDRLYYVRYDASGGASPFSTAVAVDAGTGSNVDLAKIVFDPAGDGVLVFSQLRLGIRRAYTRVFHGATGLFGPPTLIDSGGSNTLPEDVTGIDVALDANGNGTVVFSEADDVFGVRYTKSTTAFAPPVQLDTLGNVGNTVSALWVQERSGYGAVAWLQDADTSSGVRNILAVSRHSTSGSLGLASTVNPDTSQTVNAFSARVLADGSVLLAYEQAQSGGGTRVLARRQSTSGSLGMAADLGGSTSGSFAEPVTTADPRTKATYASAIVVMRRTPASGPDQAYAIRYTGGAFASAATRIDPTGIGSVVAGSLRAATDALGRSEIVFVQGQDATASAPHQRVTAVRHDPQVSANAGYGAGRLIDHGVVQTDVAANVALINSPLKFSTPVVTSLAFDGLQRAFVTYTQTDGHLTRAYLVSTAGTAASVFGTPATADGAVVNNIFAASLSTDQVVAGSAVFLPTPDATRGIAVMQQRYVAGSTDHTRVWANAWNGWNAPAEIATGATLIDGFPDAGSPRDTTDAATAVDADGTGLTVFVQHNGTNPELLWAPIGANGAHGPAATTSIDNGTANPPLSPRILIDPVSGDAHILFRQDDGSGRVQLYARRYTRSTGAVTNVSPTSNGANDPIALTTAGAGSVASYDAVFHPQDGAAYIVFRQVKNGSGDEGVFGVKVSTAGAVTGPAEHSTTTSTTVGDPRIIVDTSGNYVTAWNEGSPAILCSRHSTSSSLGMSFAGPPTAISASTTLACGAFDLAVDGNNNFTVAFERTDTTSAFPGNAILVRRRLGATGQWTGSDAVKISSGLTSTAAPVLNYFGPRLAVAANGDTLVVYRQVDDRAAIDTVNLVAATFEAATATWGSQTIIDNGDGSVSNGLDVTAAYDVTVRASTGAGVVAFVQDTDPTAGNKPHAFALPFSLSRLAQALPVFGSSADVSEGGGSATRVTDVAVVHGNGRAAWIRFLEETGTNADNTNAHCFVRSYDLETFTAGLRNHLVSRVLAQGDGNTGSNDEAENVIWSQLVPVPSGGARVIFLIAQDADGSSAGSLDRYRLFGNVIR